VKPVRLLICGVAGAATAGVVGFGGYAAVTYARYGRVDLDRHPKDELLDRFLPDPEVDEFHSIGVRAPVAITYEAAKEMDIQASPLVRAIFALRAIPALLAGEPFRPEGSQGIVQETLGIGWGVLAEVPGREIVIGACTQPWHQDVTFHALPPEEFAAFSEPGYVKIVWSLAAEPVDDDASVFVTRTRVVATDQESRRRFRLYWAPMSAGIILIRYGGLPLVKREAERRAASAVSS